MKALTLLIVLLAFACKVSANEVVIADNSLSLGFGEICLILTAIYEALCRFIPTSKSWSIIGKVLEVLTWLSNLLDRKKARK